MLAAQMAAPLYETFSRSNLRFDKSDEPVAGGRRDKIKVRINDRGIAPRFPIKRGLAGSAGSGETREDPERAIYFQNGGSSEGLDRLPLFLLAVVPFPSSGIPGQSRMRLARSMRVFTERAAAPCPFDPAARGEISSRSARPAAFNNLLAVIDYGNDDDSRAVARAPPLLPPLSLSLCLSLDIPRRVFD